MASTDHNMSQEFEDDLFYFESDHLALRGNKEYSEVLKTLLILCAQRKQSIKDYNTAVTLKKEALEDPSKILKKIVNGESLEMPPMHSIPELPVIDWSKFNAKIPEESIKQIYSNVNESSKKKESPKKEKKISNKKWTVDEQKRLEELLHVYPPEPIELRRFKKIADALGNRTLAQVTSRVQKYFLKLYQAGLPVPGRIPKSADKGKKSAMHKHQRHNHYLWKPTTFFPDLCVPVLMNDVENTPGPSKTSFEDISQQSSSSNYLISSSYHEHTDVSNCKNEDELQLELLKRIRTIKVYEENSKNLYHHVGFKCDYCGEEPIVATRWHCITCTNDSIDYCTDCILNQMYSENCHSFRHHFVPYNEKGAHCLSSYENLNFDSDHNVVQNQMSSESSDTDSDDDVNEDSEFFKEPFTSDTVNYHDVGEEDSHVDSNFKSVNTSENKLYNSTDLQYNIFDEIDEFSSNYAEPDLLFDQN